jgi:hypothetical protein
MNHKSMRMYYARLGEKIFHRRSCTYHSTDPRIAHRKSCDNKLWCFIRDNFLI